MRKHHVAILFSLLAFIGGAAAQNVSEETAARKAVQFLQQQGKTVQKAAVQCVHTETDAETPLLYVFNAGNAYVIVSAEQKTRAILAYSPTHPFDSGNIIPPVRMWLDSYRQQIQAAKKSDLPTSKAWQAATDDSLIKSVEPLLLSSWGQGRPYNRCCPKDDKNSTGHCVTGCVATALGQLAYYFRWPDNGVGSYSYQHENYGTISADFSKGYYNYSTMCDAPSQINLSASQLIAHLGTSVDMVYGPNSSGMYNHKAAYVLRNYFKFNPETQYIFRDSTNLIHDSLRPEPRYQHWDSTIIAHLDNNVPLYYAGWSKPWTDGHAFVCDGYQQYAGGDCYFHFNFGWEGQSDGYFYTSNLFPGSYNFNIAQELVVNAWPDTIRYPHQPVPANLQGSHKLYHTGSFEDGSGPFANCRCGMDYTWTLRRTKTDSVTLMRIRISCQLGMGDTLFVSSPDKNFVSQAYTETDSLITWENTIFNYDFRLVTGYRGESKGIHVSYETVHPNFCMKLVPHTKTSGTISDGSGPFSYGYNSRCEATINVKKAAGIRIHFTEFQTVQECDFLQFFDMNDSGRLLLSLSGELLQDSDFYLPSNFIYVLFESHEAPGLDGWSFDYTASLAAVGETEENGWLLYPNPAHELLFIEREMPALGKFTLLDAMGRILRSTVSGDEMVTIPIADLPDGIYFIRMEQGNLIRIRKFVKQ
ncbi:MAG: C10 family peptidase [Bacteroidales bacterium]|nr:C10 family peptidase [Bacteroidales bacterium]